ncbi:DUF551 domain-containing protein [Phytobacter diazotrophicus]
MKDETLLPDVASLEKVLEWIAGLPVPTKSATANYCRLKNFIIDYNAALQSGNSAQPEPVNKTYKLPPNSFSDDELMGMAHGDNPAANAYRELLEFRRNAANGNPWQPVTVPDGYVLVPVDPTPEMMLHKSCCQHHAWNDPDCPMRETRRLVWSHMLAAAPTAPDGWIPVSERMPDKLIPVMVMYEDGEMWSAIWSGQFWDDGCAIPDPHSITHWRDMPDAPKGV